MNPQSSALSSLLKSAFVLFALWLAYQGVSARDFTAPSTVSGTAPELR